MNILITGANGQLGRCLQDVLVGSSYNVTALGADMLDISDADQVLAVVRSSKPDVVVNAAAYTAVDKAESEPMRARQVNSLGAKLLAEACAKYSSTLVHISTDYVFDGLKLGAYRSDDSTGPTGVYGRTKLDGELAVIESGAKHLIIRTAWVFSEYGNNFLKTMLRLGQTRESLSVVADQQGSPTYAGDLARAIVDALPKASRGDGLGVYHYAGAPPCSWYDFAERIFAEASSMGILATTPALKPITTAEYPTPAKRPANSVLDSTKFQEVFDIGIARWEPAVMKVLSLLSRG